MDSMIAGLRRAASAVHDGIKDLPGIRFRRRPDPEGDIGYAVFLEMKNKAMRDKCIGVLREQQIPAHTLSGSVLLPVQPSVKRKQTRHPKWPSFTSPKGRAIEYGPKTCRQTIEIFDRFVQVRMGPKYSDRAIDRIVDAIRAFYATAV